MARRDSVDGELPPIKKAKWVGKWMCVIDLFELLVKLKLFWYIYQEIFWNATKTQEKNDCVKVDRRICYSHEITQGNKTRWKMICLLVDFWANVFFVVTGIWGEKNVAKNCLHEPVLSFLKNNRGKIDWKRSFVFSWKH